MRFCLTLVSFFVLVVYLPAQWQKMDTPFKPVNISAVDSNVIWCFTDDPVQISRTFDGGNSWKNTALPNANGFLLGSFLSGIDSTHAWFSFNHYDSGIRYVYNTQNGGQTWQSAKPPGLLNNQLIQFQQFQDFNHGFIISWDISDAAFIHHTDNGGQSWSTISLPIKGSLLGITTYGENHIWFYTGSGELWRSEDGGANWSTFQTSLIATSYGLAMAFTDSLHGLAFKDHYYDQLYRTFDGGATWQSVTWSGNPSAEKIYVWGITAIPGLNDAYIVGHNDGTTVTKDGGATWYVEHNYPDYPFSKPVFIDPSNGWSKINNQTGLYRWETTIATVENTCLTFTGSMGGKLRRSNCSDIWFEGHIPVDITNDPGIHLNVQLFYPDYAPDPGNKYRIIKNLSTGCPNCKVQFEPDPGQTTIGTLYFDIPVTYALDTTDAVICTLSPTQCADDTLHTFQFQTGYFANWFHEECFQIDSSDCAVELLTNVCGIDTNQYVIYHQVGVEPLKLGSRYEKNPSYEDPVLFYIYAHGDVNNGTCYEIIQTLYTCGTSNISNPDKADELNFHIWPNPAREAFEMTFNLPYEGHYMMYIKNSTGKLVTSQSLANNSGPHQIDTTHLDKGFYFLELWSGDQFIAVRKLIIL
jgi:hypothetical protein